jgi:phage terminase small subunit
MGNQNSGRRPRSHDLMMLRGEKNKGRFNLAEPKPPSGEVVKPEGLSTGASKVWDEMAPICVGMRTLYPSDVKSFAAYCELQATLSFASASKDARALLELRAANGIDKRLKVVVVIDAVLKLERETAQAIRPYYDMFGLNPLARNKIAVPKAEDAPKSKWEGIVA